MSDGYVNTGLRRRYVAAHDAALRPDSAPRLFGCDGTQRLQRLRRRVSSTTFPGQLLVILDGFCHLVIIYFERADGAI